MKLTYVGLAFTAFAGCASAPPVNTTLPVAALKAGEAHISRSDIGIDVRPITFTDLPANRGLLMKIAWREVDTSQAARGVGSSVSGGAGIQKFDIVPVVPLPVFIVRVVNHSAKPLDFSHAQLELVDDKGKHWELYSDVGAVTGRVQDDIIGKVSAMQNQKAQLDSVADLVNKMPLLTKRSQIAAGADWQGYLLFKMDAHSVGELDKYLQSVGKLTVQLGGIGGDATPTEITVPIEKTAAQIAVTCEGGKPQDFAHCQPQPFTE